MLMPPCRYVYNNLIMYPDTPGDGHACVTAQSVERNAHFHNNTCQYWNDDSVLELSCKSADELPMLYNNHYFTESNNLNPKVGCVQFDQLQALGNENGSTVQPAMSVADLTMQACQRLQATTCPPYIPAPAPPPPPPPPPAPACEVPAVGYKCLPAACASDGPLDPPHCKPSLQPDFRHGCKASDWECAVPASEAHCKKRAGCVAFALSPVDWGAAKLYAANFTAISNAQWRLWVPAT